MVRRTLVSLISLVALCTFSCGPGGSATNNAQSSNNPQQQPDPCEQYFAQDDGAGMSCDGLGSCPSVDCLCADGSVIGSSSCFNGSCRGIAACEDSCADSGGVACQEPVDDGNNTANNDGNNQTSGNNDGNNQMCVNDCVIGSEYTNLQLQGTATWENHPQLGDQLRFQAELSPDVLFQVIIPEADFLELTNEEGDCPGCTLYINEANEGFPNYSSLGRGGRSGDGMQVAQSGNITLSGTINDIVMDPDLGATPYGCRCSVGVQSVSFSGQIN